MANAEAPEPPAPQGEKAAFAAFAAVATEYVRLGSRGDKPDFPALKAFTLSGLTGAGWVEAGPANASRTADIQATFDFLESRPPGLLTDAVLRTGVQTHAERIATFRAPGDETRIEERMFRHPSCGDATVRFLWRAQRGTTFTDFEIHGSFGPDFADLAATAISSEAIWRQLKSFYRSQLGDGATVAARVWSGFRDSIGVKFQGQCCPSWVERQLRESNVPFSAVYISARMHEVLM